MTSAEETYRKLTDIEHVLLRPGMYVGSIKPHTESKYLLNNNNKFELQEITYIPAFLKLFDEIIMNSVDEHKRQNSRLDTIKIDITDNTISVWDNGGIPVVIHKEHKEWIPEMIFSNLKAGSNFNDDTDKRTGAGLNGVGSTITNIFSSTFKVVTADGKNKFTQTFSDNMHKRSKVKVIPHARYFTEITFTPDYLKFGMMALDEIHTKLIHKRVLDIAGCNPSLRIFFNGKLIKIKSFKDYIKHYAEEFFYETAPEWSIGVALSDNGFQQVSFANSAETSVGGTHVEYIMNQITDKLKDYFSKKHKTDVRTSELKNHIFLFLNTNVINPAFSAQTKEELITEPKDFGTSHLVGEKLIKQILHSEIVNSILDWINQKKLAQDNKIARQLNHGMARMKVEKLVDAKSTSRNNCSLMVFEGDSAMSAFRKYRNPDVQGAFSLRGKFINALELTNKKLVGNDEAVNLMASIGLRLGSKADPVDLRYGKIIISVDADVDGASIAALLINFFYRFWPALFERGLIYRLETPIVVVQHHKTKKKISFYSQEEYDKWLPTINEKDYDHSYKKGLAALLDDEYKEIIQNPRLLPINHDSESKKYLDIWFGKDSDLRKTEMLK